MRRLLWFIAGLMIGAGIAKAPMTAQPSIGRRRRMAVKAAQIQHYGKTLH